ncbi:MAG: PQQ-dependent sugar dehydrogenase, partial [Flavobacteriaceae bacterium]
RRGEVMHFDSESGTLKELVKLDVYHTALNAPDVNVENGLMGLQKDPDFEDNQWIYLYFSPTGDKYVNRLSRFKYIDGEFDLSSEQIILEVPTDREICCHTGGSIAFGPDKLLYLSTGDNSTPFDEPDADFVNQGYAPLNDLPGKSQYDARRSSGNTNDLRGKVLRIKVESDGSYSIPEGNLFPEGKAKTRPEIYTMGHRNPYRISIDQKNSNLYWGDVGPDAQEDSLQMRGPRGYDELNQATKAGNFGWPLFIGNNGAYVAYNYKNGKSGVAYDPLRPVNDSRNNTGISELPEAIPAMVYYPYAASPDFPQVGTGGRNAMAGPVYYSDLYEGGEKLPSYFDGKLFFYDWMRGWIKAISFFEDGTFNKMEPFASEIELNNLIDMELGPDGRLYLLEYGSGWYTQNPDSGLSYVEYNGGNRPPIIDDFVVDVDSGPLPLEVVLKVRARDLEKDSLSYIWDLGDGNTMETVTPELSYSYGEVGEYEVSVRAKDPSEASVKSELINIVAGNSRPQVTIELKSANQSFYLPGLPIVYEVSVVDTESEEPVDLDQVYVAVDYITGMDESQLSAGHKAFSAVENGKALSLSLDCKACHKEKDVSIGPSYFEVSNKYKNDPQAGSYLQQKMITGGAGVWGEVAMPAHPDLSEAESGMLVKYILSLANKDDLKKNSLPAKGVVVAESGSPNTLFQLSASYTDQGYGGVKALTGYAAVRLKSNTFLFSDQIPHEGLIPFNFNNTDLFLLPAEDSWFALNNLDLRGIGSAVMMVGWQQAPLSGLNFELRLDAPDGPKIGSGSLPKPSPNQEGGIVRFRLDKGSDLKNQNVYFVYRHDSGKARGESPIALLNISFQAK